MCKRCAPLNPRNYPRQVELMDILTPHVLAAAAIHDIIAVKPLGRRIIHEVPLSELCTNRATVSRLVKRILEEQGYTLMPGSSPSSVWMHRVTLAQEVEA